MEPRPETLESRSRPPAAPRLVDAWAPGRPIPLDGVLERQQFPPWLTAVLGLIAAVLLFQLVITPIVLVVLLVLSGIPAEEIAQNLQTLFSEQVRIVLSANTVGQVLGLAAFAWGMARLHTREAGAFLRLRAPEAGLLGLSVVGLAALMPVVQWLGTVNQQLPLPEWWQALEQSQIDLIEQVLSSDLGFTFSLVVLAITPALCEELLFRGYVQRQAERSMGAAWGIVFVGFTFGLFHLRLSQIVPLSLLGVYLAYLTWRTGSLWPAILVHFLNNGFAVAVATYIGTRPDLSMADVEQYEVPWYAVVGGAMLSVVVLRMMHQRADAYLARSRPGPRLDSYKTLDDYGE